MPEIIRVGILGAGWAGKGHAQAYSQLPHVKISALWSRTRTSAEILARDLNQPDLIIYDQWQNLIEQSAVDVISVATPPMLRREPVLMAIDQGCHVLIEKPFSVGLADARAMTQAAHAVDTVSAICFNWRYAPAFQAARRLIQAGQIGQIRDIRTEWCWRLTQRDFIVHRPWMGRMDISDGLLGDGMSHDFDKARFLTGAEFTDIVSQITSTTIKADNDFQIAGGSQMHMAKLTGDIFGDFRFTSTVGENRWYCVLNGDEGSLWINYGDTLRIQRADDEQALPVKIMASENAPADIEIIQHDWNRLIADFIKAIRDGGVNSSSLPNLPTIQDGLRCQEIIAAARQSDDQHRWVSLIEM